MRPGVLRQDGRVWAGAGPFSGEGRSGDGHWVALSTHRAWHLDCALCLLVQLSIGDGEHRDPLLLLWRMQLPTFGLGRGVKRLPEHSYPDVPHCSSPPLCAEVVIFLNVVYADRPSQGVPWAR